ncbi:winged helix-turn-helix domain-containing protein [Enterobacter cancerogenus]|uniref:winged helix-turn-helix domain-containing protein n=1 Tax=Enterobacter cancerogenus TaxID=69218 RepID=UPI00235E87C9|nr:winged helix-turn-helix domain-containing protein [Enterobacter cancerogenus]
MHDYYLINESVEFHPVTNTLRDTHNPDNIVPLYSPSGRCLLLLLNRTGEVVTRHELMVFVWEQRGMMVSSNTYYQSIYVLRKGLKRIGLGDDLLLTLPRVGLTLTSNTRVKKLSADNNIKDNDRSINSIKMSEIINKEKIPPRVEVFNGNQKKKKTLTFSVLKESMFLDVEIKN